MKSISTHVLDITRGRPAKDLPITIARKDGEAFTTLKSGKTDADGRIKDLVPEGSLVAGVYRITFDTSAYFSAQGTEGFYPEASIVFTIKDAEQHYHVP